MEIVKAGPDIVQIRDDGFDVNVNVMVPGKCYVFKFLDSKYAIRTVGDGSLIIREVE